MTEKQVRYAAITDRLFASLIDVSLLFFIVMPLSAILIPNLIGTETPVFDTIRMIRENYPDQANNDDFIANKLFYEHREALDKGVRIWFNEVLIQMFIMGLYFVPFIHIKSQTIGKFILGIKVIDKTTLKGINVSQSLIRYASYALSVFPLFLGIIFASFRKDKRTWHDLLADTIVIYDEKRWYKVAFDKILERIKK